MKLSLNGNKKILIVSDATEQELEQLNVSLTKRIESWRFNPLVKKGVWDGYVSYFKNDKYIPAGLWKEVLDIAKKFKLNIEFDDSINKLFDRNIKYEDFEIWVITLLKESNLTPRDYQIEAAFNILKYRKCLTEMATSSGKTLVAYLVIAYLLEFEKTKKILYVVPNVSLVIQASEDFYEYSDNSQIDLEIQQIYSGKKIKDNCNVVVGTYQSLTKKSKEYFDVFNAVIVDETHKAKAISIKKILEKCTCDYSIGLSGTIPKPGTLDRLTLMSGAGPVVTDIDTKTLQDSGYVSKCKVSVLDLNYAPQKTRDSFESLQKSGYDSKKVFELEKNYVIQSNTRLDFVTDVISKVTKNTLVLFHRIEYGKTLYKELRKLNDKAIYYVDGSVDADIRETYKEKMEHGDDVILIASFGTFSTGISVKNIHNIFFTESFKSEVIIRQSIGRGLRLRKGKDMLNIIDFVDNFSTLNWQNHLYRHGIARQKIYKEQHFPFTVKKIKLA